MKTFKCPDCSRERDMEDNVTTATCICGGSMILNTQSKSYTNGGKK